MQVKRFYFIKEEFYEKFPNCGLMKGEDNIQHGRPCFYCLFYDELFWMIPISSRVEKYERIREEKCRRYAQYDGILFGYVNGERRAFLLQNIFPITAEYVEKMYKVNRGTVPVIVNDNFAEEIGKKARKIIRLYKNGVNVVLTKLNDILAGLRQD